MDSEPVEVDLADVKDSLDLQISPRTTWGQPSLYYAVFLSVCLHPLQNGLQGNEQYLVLQLPQVTMPLGPLFLPHVLM